MTHRERVLAALESAGANGLTGIELYDRTGSMRFGARIKELRDAGHLIDSERVGTSNNGAAIFRYWLRPSDQLFAAPAIDTRQSSAHYLEGEAA